MNGEEKTERWTMSVLLNLQQVENVRVDKYGEIDRGECLFGDRGRFFREFLVPGV